MPGGSGQQNPVSRAEMNDKAILDGNNDVGIVHHGVLGSVAKGIVGERTASVRAEP